MLLNLSNLKYKVYMIKKCSVIETNWLLKIIQPIKYIENPLCYFLNVSNLRRLFFWIFFNLQDVSDIFFINEGYFNQLEICKNSRE